MRDIIIKRYALDDVLFNEDKFNVSNYYIIDGIPQPDDYEDKLKQTMTKYWIDLFHDPKDYYKIILDGYDLDWMKHAFKIGCITGLFPHLYQDDLNYTCKRYELPRTPKEGWFVRTDRTSLKSGSGGIGPYYSFEEIIKSMVSSTKNHRCFNLEDETCTVYFMKWKVLDKDKEFRVFVYNNQIMGISQQYLYCKNIWLSNKSDKYIKNIVNELVIHIESHILDKLSTITDGSYVMDIALIDSSNAYEYYFIEINTFGEYYSSGSALFQWRIDAELLSTFNDDLLEFRLTY